eukprot:TRINITY_DN45663_c0_g1_i1.p1 TRINITY_DN45663_c0_g1~~TRINITY_DN45663_c0_g1_i1.p1  ORF type:complete len:323 (-),score=69.10 TRINITY_DN45663_c0_g1_i1:172-1140(-)
MSNPSPATPSHDLFALEKAGTLFGHEPGASDDDELGNWTIIDVEGQQSDSECDKQPFYPKAMAKECHGAESDVREPIEEQQKVFCMIADSTDLTTRTALAIDTENVEKQNDSQQEEVSMYDVAVSWHAIAMERQTKRWQADGEHVGKQRQVVDIIPSTCDDAALLALPNARDEFHDRVRMQVHRRRLRRRPAWNLHQPQVPHRFRAGSSPRNQQTATCSGCGSSLLQVRCYRCKVCPNYDLCCSCFARCSELHDPSHAFLRNKQSSSAEKDIMGRKKAAQDTAATSEPPLIQIMRSAEDAAAAAMTKLSDLLLQTGWRPLHP